MTTSYSETSKIPSTSWRSSDSAKSKPTPSMLFPSKVTSHESWVSKPGPMSPYFHIADERRDISNTICRIILAIDCGESETDLEASLKLFTECRGKFSELDLVQQLLVQRVILLAVKARKKLLSKDKILTQRGKGFLQVCSIVEWSLVSPERIFVSLFSSRPAWLMFTSRSRPYRTCSSSSV